MIQQRNLAVCIILSLVTCGIYGLIWLYWLNEDTNTVSNEPNPTSGGIVILLSIVTCGIYGIYWAYKQGQKLDRANEMRGMTKSDRGVIYLLLCIFGLGIVAYALMQDELNTLAAAPAGNTAPQQTYAQPQQPAQPAIQETVNIDHPTEYSSQDETK